MKRMIRLWMLASIAAWSLYPAFAQEYTLRMNVKEGEVYKYKMTMDIDFGGQTVVFSGTFINKIVKVENDGNFVTESSWEKSVIKFGDQEMPGPESPPVKITFKPNGQVVRYEADGVGGQPMSSMFTATYPDKPVKIGDKWDAEIMLDENLPKAKVEYTVSGIEKVNDIETLKIRVVSQGADAKAKEGENTQSYEGHFWVDLKSGMVVRAEMKFKGLPAQGAPMPLDGTMKIELIK